MASHSNSNRYKLKTSTLPCLSNHILAIFHLVLNAIRVAGTGESGTSSAQCRL